MTTRKPEPQLRGLLALFAGGAALLSSLERTFGPSLPTLSPAGHVIAATVTLIAVGAAMLAVLMKLTRETDDPSPSQDGPVRQPERQPEIAAATPDSGRRVPAVEEKNAQTLRNLVVFVVGVLPLLGTTNVGKPVQAWLSHLPHTVTTLLGFVAVMSLVAIVPAFLLGPIRRDDSG